MEEAQTRKAVCLEIRIYSPLSKHTKPHLGFLALNGDSCPGSEHCWVSVQHPTQATEKQRWHFPSSKTELENVPGRSVPWGIGFHLRLLRCLTGSQNTLLNMTPSDHAQICLKIYNGNRVFLCGGLYYKKLHSTKV